jgi:hypothetical protein
LVPHSHWVIRRKRKKKRSLKPMQIDRFLQKPCYANTSYWTCIFCRIFIWGVSDSEINLSILINE